MQSLLGRPSTSPTTLSEPPSSGSLPRPSDPLVPFPISLRLWRGSLTGVVASVTTTSVLGFRGPTAPLVRWEDRPPPTQSNSLPPLATATTPFYVEVLSHLENLLPYSFY